MLDNGGQIVKPGTHYRCQHTKQQQLNCHHLFIYSLVREDVLLSKLLFQRYLHTTLTGTTLK